MNNSTPLKPVDISIDEDKYLPQPGDKKIMALSAVSKVRTVAGDIDDERRWNISAANPNCPDCYGRGFQGYQVIEGGKIYLKNHQVLECDRLPIVCRCVPRRSLSDQITLVAGRSHERKH
jgi:hypothetical protein